MADPKKKKDVTSSVMANQNTRKLMKQVGETAIPRDAEGRIPPTPAQLQKHAAYEVLHSSQEADSVEEIKEFRRRKQREMGTE